VKNVLLLVHDDAGQEARLQAALDLTRALRGHLTCLDVVVMAPIAGDTFGLSGGAMLLDIERATESINRDRLKQRLMDEDVSWEWAEATDYLEPALRAACDLADVIVVNREITELPLPDVRQVAGSVALHARKPVLAVPRDPLGFDAAGAALVAWDGSDAAAAALTASVPLLSLASSVSVYELQESKVASTAERAATYLSRHGIHAELVTEVVDPASVAPILLSKAASGTYAYIVMGAYSRPRLIERIFGGVTRRMLRESPLPLFIAH
jgi:nucleotide-binding universal stress UspA family protein